ncbi:MAG: HTTM domain-containing protein [Fimbriimonas sp.]
MSQAEPTSPGFLKSLDNYWFGHGSPVTLGVYRILLGSLAFVNFVMIGVYWESWFSERGFFPAWLAQLWMYPTVPAWANGPAIPRINVLNGVTDPRVTFPFYVLITLASITTTLGLWTRVSTFILAVGITTLHHRNAAMLHGGDTVLRVMAIYLALSPCGQACSLDRIIGIWKGHIPATPVSVSLWSQRLISFNIALIYFTTVWLKYFGDLWKNGTATYFPARLAEFYRFPVPAFMNELPMVKVTTYGTLATEFALATLVFFRPLRKWVLLAGIAMHAYIEYSMNIPLFSFLMVTAYVCFYEGDEVTEWAKRVGARFRRFATTVRYPLGTQLRTPAAAFFDAVDPLDLVSYEHGTETKWTAVRTDGKETSPVFGAWSRSVGSWGFAWIPGIWKRLMEASTEPVPDLEPEAPSPAPSAPKRHSKSKSR